MKRLKRTPEEQQYIDDLLLPDEMKKKLLIDQYIKWSCIDSLYNLNMSISEALGMYEHIEKDKESRLKFMTIFAQIAKVKYEFSLPMK